MLGPRGSCQTKTGTVTMDVAKAVSDVKAGKIDFKATRLVLYAAIGKASLMPKKLQETQELLTTLVKLKPQAAKGVC